MAVADDRPSEVLFRGRIELRDPAGRIPRNAYQRARGLPPAEAAELVDAAASVAAAQAAAALERVAAETGASVHTCAVLMGVFNPATPLESILASHALAHAAEGRLYQRALLDGAESNGLAAVGVPKRTIWEDAEAALAVPPEELRRRLEGLRQELGPPWAEDQKLAALAAWIALARLEPHHRR